MEKTGAIIPFFHLIGPAVSKQKSKKGNTNSLFAVCVANKL
jgi:hypothetical protein